jgi:hypothetical protein
MLNFETAVSIIRKASNDFTTADLRKLYKKAALTCHPDRQSDCIITMQELNAAWEVVSKRTDNFEQQKTEYPDQVESHKLYNLPIPTLLSLRSLLVDAFEFVEDTNGSWNLWQQNRFKTIYFVELQAMLHQYASSIRIVDLTNALETGKTCDTYSINWGLGCDAEGYSNFLNWADSLGATILDVFNHISKMDYQTDRFGNESAVLENGLQVFRNKSKSNSTFSPFKLAKLKPLTEIPGKFTVVHLIRLIANGQYRQLKTNYSLTDDYAWDAANHGGRKLHTNPFPLLKSLIEDRSSGFYVYQRNNDSEGIELSFSEYSAENKSLIVELSNRFPTVDLVDSELLH